MKKIVKLKKLVVVWTVLLALLTLIVVREACFPTQNCKQKYEKCAKEALVQHEMRKRGEVRRLGKQQRFGVTKHMWMAEKKPRLELELNGAKSEVSLEKSFFRSKVLETFTDVTGTIQEELFWRDLEGNEYSLNEEGKFIKKKTKEIATCDEATLKPFQRFRYFEADNAVYDYYYNTLIAHTVAFWTYEAPSHAFLSDFRNLWPTTSGTAASMTLFHEGAPGTIQFSAENLNMEVVQK